MKINRPGKIIDINYIAALPVSELEIEASHIEGIEVLNGKSSLTNLTLIDCGDTDFTKLAILPALTDLSLSGNFPSISFINKYKNIEKLKLECGCESLSGIEELEKLSFLEMSGWRNSNGRVYRNHPLNSFKHLDRLKLKELRFHQFSFSNELTLSLLEVIERGTIKKISIDKCYNLYNENNKNASEFDISQSLITKIQNLNNVVDVYHHDDDYFGDSLEISCK
tara:strand:+ start:99 stop:770 length:672 start_codon:yes stop_codon:yes gene_type:complete